MPINLKHLVSIDQGFGHQLIISWSNLLVKCSVIVAAGFSLNAGCFSTC